MPKKKVSSKASEITGVTVVGETMFVKGHSVETLSIQSALTGLFGFLKKCQNDKPVVLIGHNIESFDCKVLLNAVENCDKFTELQSHVVGFMDTYKLFKKCYPGLTSYKQEELVTLLMGQSYTAHSALYDVKALQSLVNYVDLDQAAQNDASFCLDRTVKSYNIAKNVASNIPSLQTMIDKKVVSKGIARSIAGSGLQFTHLCVVSKRNGIDGIRQLLSEVSDGKIRVTKSERIILAIADYVSQYH